MSVKFANNAFGTLNAGINNSATSITLSSGQGARFPTLASGEYFYATLIDTSNNLEVVKCTARSTDVLTITRAQESTTAQAFAIGDRIELRVTAAGLTDAANPYDKDTSSTGSFALPSGTTAQQPTAADSEGHIRYDTDDSVVYYSDGSNWVKISSVFATLTSAAGNIFDGAASTLTLTGKGFQTANLVVNFFQASDSIDEDVTVTPASDTSATVAVPAAVYNNVTSGNLVSITVTNSDGVASAAVTKTALALPSGGTVTTSGNFRIHTFTSSGTFTASLGLTVDHLVIAGGGGGGPRGGGGGAGGFIATTSSSISSGSYAVTIGAGGAQSTDSQLGGTANSGSNSSFNSVTAIGGGKGGVFQSSGGNGGSGGGAGRDSGSGVSGGSGTSGQGNNGGSGNGVSCAPGGGGGGAGGAGAAGSSHGSGNERGGMGGAAKTSTISGSTVYYAGGGGGATGCPPSGQTNFGLGGGTSTSSQKGGGGDGGINPSRQATAATANTGGGGGGGGDAGGSGYLGGNYTGAPGGSGVVIIKYQL